MTDQNSMLNKQRAGSFGITTFFPKLGLQVLVEEAGSATCLNKVHAWERNPWARMKHHSLPRAPVRGWGKGAGAPRATQSALAGFNLVFYWHSSAGPSSAKAGVHLIHPGSFKCSEAQAPFPEILI